MLGKCSNYLDTLLPPNKEISGIFLTENMGWFEKNVHYNIIYICENLIVKNLLSSTIGTGATLCLHSK
jgi:hypothetical protein